jgi:hypothetical protein
LFGSCAVGRFHANWNANFRNAFVSMPQTPIHRPTGYSAQK